MQRAQRPLTAARLRKARLQAFVWRFRELALANALFNGVPKPCILQRPFSGFTLHLDVSRSNAQKLLYLLGERFLDERHVLRAVLRRGMRVVDVGANIGYYTLFIAKALGPGGSIVCFEPEPSNLVELNRNISANQLENVEVVAKAVGREDGRASLASGINSGVVAGDLGDFAAPICRLDTAISSPVDFIKIDVEGYEGQVLDGARSLLRHHLPTLFVEIHPTMIAPPYSTESVLGLLGEHYPRVHLFVSNPQLSLTNKVATRYLGRGLRLTDASRQLTSGDQRPFWAVATADRAIQF
jgi:FkbM family methyltransferase